MASNKKSKITRKDFIKKTSAGIVGMGLLGKFGRLFPGSENHKYRVLGRTGMKVTPVGLGATRTLEHGIVEAALDAGINFIDTGRNYFDGKNEEMIGEAIQGARDQVIIQSKLRIRTKGHSLKSDKTAELIKRNIETSVKQSLAALKTDYIDIMLIHGADSVDLINHEVVQECFRNLKQAGTIRAAGFSTHKNQVELMAANNKHKFYDVVMVTFNHKGSLVHSKSGRYSEWDQPALIKELELAEKNDTGIVAMKTCSAGPCAFEGDDKPSFKSALKWVLQHSFVNTLAVAAVNYDQLNENVQVMNELYPE